MFDPNLRPYATSKQWEYYCAVHEHGSQRAAARAVAVSRSAISQALTALERNAARRGYSPDHDMTHPAPPGFNVKGTSTLYDLQTGEARIQWVKTQQGQISPEEYVERLSQVLRDELPRVDPTPLQMANFTDDLLAAYPIGDHHVGMLAWDGEVGANYDLDIASDLLRGCFQYLVDANPPCRQGLIAVLGDFLHVDSWRPETPRGKNLLDTDTRFPPMYETAVAALRFIVDQALAKHETVHAIIELGNHDPTLAVALAVTLRIAYENEPRVTIDDTFSHFHYFRFHKNIIMTHHGHGRQASKPENMKGILMEDRREWISECEYFYAYTGHRHHREQKAFGSFVHETFGVLPPEDAHAFNEGYRSIRELNSIVYHKDWGYVSRNRAHPAMMAALRGVTAQ